MALHRAAAPLRPDAQLTGDGSSEQIRLALQRVVRRWQQLPLDHALRVSGPVRSLAQDIADEVADTTGRRRIRIPDLGPATCLDQLQVMVYDAQQVGATSHLADRLTALLHDIG